MCEEVMDHVTEEQDGLTVLCDVGIAWNSSRYMGPCVRDCSHFLNAIRKRRLCWLGQDGRILLEVSPDYLDVQ